MSMTWTFVALGAILLAAGTITIVALRLVQALRIIVSLESRLARLQEGTTLLAETVEMGFRDCATELERLGGQIAQPPPARPRAKQEAKPRATTARVRAAARRGRAIHEIAAEEQVSEGEVRLRLSLADAAPASGPARKGRERAAVRP
jgi:hypothetical protein